jgi:hypothetical protein
MKTTLFLIMAGLIIISGCKNGGDFAIIESTTTTNPADQYKDAGQGTVPEGALTNLEQWVAAYQQAPAPYTGERTDFYGLPKSMFTALPKLPGDFKAIKVLFDQNRWVKPIEKDYYTQPEWYPTFETIGVNVLKEVALDRFGGNGYMVYPSDSILYLHAGESMLRQFWVRSGFIVITYQGMSWGTVYPVSGTIYGPYTMADGAEKVNQDAAIASQSFTVSVSPSEYILPPNFPIFSPDATVSMLVNVTVNPGTKPGNYIIGIDTKSPGAENERAWTEKYLTRYTSGSMVSANRPKYMIFVSVLEGEV